MTKAEEEKDMAKGYWMIRTYEAGDVGEKTKYWVPGEKPSRSSRKAKAEIKKQEQNEHSTTKRMARLMNENYRPGDYLLGLDYSELGMERLLAWAREQGMDPDTADETELMDILRLAAEHALRLVIRRVGREVGRGVLVKVVAITSDMDGDTGEIVRIHHHLVVPRACKEAFVKKWADAGWGGVDWEPLSNQHDYTPIAEYFAKQVRKVPDAKKYFSTRNLVRPEPKDRTALTAGELRVPTGASLLHRSEFKPGRPQYIRYILPEAKRRRVPYQADELQDEELLE